MYFDPSTCSCDCFCGAAGTVGSAAGGMSGLAAGLEELHQPVHRGDEVRGAEGREGEGRGGRGGRREGRGGSTLVLQLDADLERRCREGHLNETMLRPLGLRWVSACKSRTLDWTMDWSMD